MDSWFDVKKRTSWIFIPGISVFMLLYFVMQDLLGVIAGQIFSFSFLLLTVAISGRSEGSLKKILSDDGLLFVAVLGALAAMFAYLGIAAAWTFLELVEKIQTFQAIVLLITAFIVAYYTYETKQLRVETQKQTDLMIRPFVVLYYGTTYRVLNNLSIGEPEVKIKNVGNGAAVNVRVEDVETNMNQILKCTQKIDVLPSGEEQVVKFVDKDEEEIESDEWSNLFDPDYYEELDEMTDYGGEFIRIDISYADVNLNQYKNIIVINAKGTKIKKEK